MEGMVTLAIIITVLGVCQLMQWIGAVMNLGDGDFTHKSEFIIALIPGRFFYSTAKKIWDLAEDFVMLR